MRETYSLVFLGPPLHSGEGAAHAAIYRPLLGALRSFGHEVSYLEPAAPAGARRPGTAPLPGIARYGSLEELDDLHSHTVAEADLVVVGSHVPDGRQVAAWVLQTAQGVRAFYDLDTPGMLGRLAGGEFGQLHPDQIPKFDLYLSSTGGPWLNVFRSTYHPPRCEPLYCSVDPEVHRPEGGEPEFDLGYLGDYDGDRRAKLEEMLLKPAEHLEQGFFAVAGEGYPEDFHWPRNVIHVEHLPVTGHARFFAGQRYTLDLARREILSAGWAPTPALFEAMATGTPVISDAGRSLEPFFKIGQEILVAETAQEVLNHLARLPESSRQRLAERARGRVLASHTAAHRAEELERLLRRARNDAARAALRT